ncbi:hypothetical protein METP3_03062 [Methanosarcinales archaeon]|nr:hypothetical protein METP3_03062 [Methanosarcinales archaeon]
MNENKIQKTDKQDMNLRIAPKSLDTGSNGQFQQYMTFFGIYQISK